MIKNNKGGVATKRIDEIAATKSSTKLDKLNERQSK